MSRSISFRCRFPPDECVRRLNAATEPDHGDFFEDLSRTHAVLARLTDRRLRLRVRHASTRNALAPIFYGRFEATPGGTVLRGRFRIHPGMLAFVVVSLTGASLMAAWILVLSARFLLMPPLAIASFAAVLWVLWRLGRADQGEILDLIEHVLETHHQ